MTIKKIQLMYNGRVQVHAKKCALFGLHLEERWGQVANTEANIRPCSLHSLQIVSCLHITMFHIDMHVFKQLHDNQVHIVIISIAVTTHQSLQPITITLYHCRHRWVV